MRLLCALFCAYALGMEKGRGAVAGLDSYPRPSGFDSPSVQRQRRPAMGCRAPRRGLDSYYPECTRYGTHDQQSKGGEEECNRSNE